MCCSTLFGFIVGIVLFKVVRRYFMWRMGYGGCAGSGGCGHSDGDGWRRRGYWRWSSYSGSAGYDPRQGSGSGGGSFSGRPLDDLVRGLELNERQQAEAGPVFSFIKARLGLAGPRVETALNIVAAERFEPGPLLPQLGDLPESVQRELIDGLEHLHTILISEQREALRKELQRR